MSPEEVESEARRLTVQQQEDWLDSEEFREARGRWLKGPNCKDGNRFEHSKEFADARYLYRKRINGGGDGNDG